jgi:hypothetical protein
MSQHIVQLNIDVPLLCRLNAQAVDQPGVATLIADVLSTAVANIKRGGFSALNSLALQTFASGEPESVGQIENAAQAWSPVSQKNFQVTINLSDISQSWQTRDAYLCTILSGLSDHCKRYDKGATLFPWRIKNDAGFVALSVLQSQLNCLNQKHLKLFEVTVVRSIAQMQVLTLEAETEEQAKNFALNQPAHHFDWKTAEVVESPSIFGSKDLSEELLGPANLAAVVDATETPKG